MVLFHINVSKHTFLTINKKKIFFYLHFETTYLSHVKQIVFEIL